MKQIEINGQKYELKEINYLDIFELSKIADRKEYTIKLCELSGVSKEQIESLKIQEGNKLIGLINELNGLDQTNFQQKPIDA